ncbi:MAG: PASTA domain-containing protein [Acidimicrobiales bacterium]
MPVFDRADSSVMQRLFLVVALVALVAAAMAGTTAFASSLNLVTDTSQQDLEEVPVVVGLDEDDAVEAVTALGFEVEIVRHQNLDVPTGQVARQEPVAGSRLPVGSPVEIWVSAGDAFVPIPQVVGSPLEDVEFQLFVMGLGVGEVSYEENDATAGEVIEQTPAAGEVVAHGTLVALVVSAGPPAVAIPDVRGQHQSDASRVLRDAGFRVTVQERSSWSVDPGFVMSTDPAAGEELQRGSVVLLYVSSGRPPTTTTTAPPTTAPTTTTTRPGSTTSSTTTTTAPTTTSTTAPDDDDD